MYWRFDLSAHSLLVSFPFHSYNFHKGVMTCALRLHVSTLLIKLKEDGLVQMVFICNYYKKVKSMRHNVKKLL